MGKPTKQKEKEGFKLDIPSIELGSWGGRGARGQGGQDGTRGGKGGNGGDSGAGGGALMIVAQGEVIFDGTAKATGADGVAGTVGEDGVEVDLFIKRSTAGKDPRPAPSLSDFLLELFFGEEATVYAGFGGDGGKGGQGGQGGPGSFGGDGAGGAGGTIIMVGTKVVGDGSFLLKGGNTTHPQASTRGSDGRLYLGTNHLSPTAIVNLLDVPEQPNDPAKFDVSSTDALGYDTRIGTNSPNPFIKGVPQTPNIHSNPDLNAPYTPFPTGAEAFGNHGKTEF